MATWLQHLGDRIGHFIQKQAANTILAGPASGSAAEPDFRALIVADLPGGSGTTVADNTFYGGAATGAATAPTFRVLDLKDLNATVDGSAIGFRNLVHATPATATGAPVFRALVDYDLPGVGTVHPSANTLYGGPTSGAAASPTFRALVTADLPAGTGTVTSVALTVPTGFSVSGSPVTTTGTLAITLSTETANTVWAGPTSGGAATPTFRALVQADLPNTIAKIYGGTPYLVQSSSFTGTITSGNRSVTGATVTWPTAFPNAAIAVAFTVQWNAFAAGELPVVCGLGATFGTTTCTVDVYAYAATAANRAFTVYYTVWGW